MVALGDKYFNAIMPQKFEVADPIDHEVHDLLEVARTGTYKSLVNRVKNLSGTNENRCVVLQATKQMLREMQHNKIQGKVLGKKIAFLDQQLDESFKTISLAQKKTIKAIKGKFFADYYSKKIKYIKTPGSPTLIAKQFNSNVGKSADAGKALKGRISIWTLLKGAVLVGGAILAAQANPVAATNAVASATLPRGNSMTSNVPIFPGLEMPQVTPEFDTTYESLAEVASASKDCGTKFAQLLDLNEIVMRHHLPGVEVPIPHGFESAQVEAFLRQTESGREMLTLWGQLGEKYAIYQQEGKSGAHFLGEPGISETLEKIQASIKTAFNSAAAPEIFGKFNGGKALEQWMDQYEKQGLRLIVRSSGDEDSNVSNAGGNLSVPDVAPKAAEVMKAAGEVVASYFSTDSLKNRLLGKLDPFHSPLKLGLFAQEYIGEPVGGFVNARDIPIAAVMFTDEPFYVGDEPGTARWKFTRISALPGNAQAVVGNEGLVPDNIYVLQSRSKPDQLYIFYDNQDKPTRLAPVRNDAGEVELVHVDNPQELVLARTLDDTMIKRIFQLGQIVENATGRPTDMEVMIQKGTIKPVQQRRVNRREAMPTYIDPKLVAVTPDAMVSQIKAKVVVSGLSSALIIRSTGKVLTESRLEDAEGSYQEDAHGLVVVGSDEPSNSHPVINFAGLGVPCLYYKNLDKVLTLAGQTGVDRQALLVDMQSGTVYLWNEAQVGGESLIKNGYRTHPAPISISLDILRSPIRIQGKVKIGIPPNLKNLMDEIEIAEIHRIAHDILPAIREHEYVAELGARTADLRGRVSLWGPLATVQANRTLEVAQLLQERVDLAFNEYGAMLGMEASPPSRLENLFHAKVIDTLLFEPDGSSSQASFSLLNIHEAFEGTRLAQDYQASLPFPARYVDEYLQGHNAALSDQVEEVWKNFLTDLEKEVQSGQISSLDMEAFREMISILDQSEALSTWITLFFDPRSQEMESSQELLKTFLADFNPETKTAIKQFKIHLGQIQRMRGALMRLSDPKTAPAMAKTLANLLKYYTDLEDPNGFIKTLEAISPIGKTVAIHLMNQVVALYDDAIKAVEMSRNFVPPENKVALVKEMLGPYFNLMKSWTNKYGKVDRRFTEDGLSRIQEKLNTALNIPSQLRRSYNFDVSIWTLGSRTAYGTSPDTLGDIFMFAHQNLLAAIARESSSLLPEERFLNLKLSSLFITIYNQIKSLPSIYRGDIVGMDFPKGKFKLMYNIALRDHSSSITFESVKGIKYIVMTVNILGGNENDRNGNIKNYLTCLSQTNVLPLQESPSASAYSLRFSWKISTTDQAALVQTELHSIYHFSKYRLFINLLENLAIRSHYLYPAMKLMVQKYPHSDGLDTLDNRLKVFGFFDTNLSGPQIEEFNEWFSNIYNKGAYYGADSSYKELFLEDLQYFVKRPDFSETKVMMLVHHLIQKNDFKVAFEILDVLIRSGKCKKEALGLAQDLFDNPNLFYMPLIRAIFKGSLSENQKNGLQLYSGLVKAGFEAAYAPATKAMTSSFLFSLDQIDKGSIRELAIALISRGLSYSETFSVANEQGDQLIFRALIRQNQYLPEILSFAQENLSTEIMNELAMKNLYQKETLNYLRAQISAFRVRVGEEDFEDLKATNSLLMTLKKKGQNVKEEISQVVNEWIRRVKLPHNAILVIEMVDDLMKVLGASKHPSYYTLQLSLWRLVSILKGKMFLYAPDLISNYLLNGGEMSPLVAELAKHTEPKWYNQKLFKKLINLKTSEDFYKGIASIFEPLAKAESIETANNALNMFTQLVNKGKGIEEAKRFCEAYVARPDKDKSKMAAFEQLLQGL